MPKYVVSSEGPISVRQINRPDLPAFPGLPEWEAGQLPVFPERPRPPEGWERPDLPELPPREEWPPLPPWLQPGVGLPIPPTPEFPMVPIDPPEVDPPDIWPPIPSRPELPDFSGKTLVLACFYVSRHVKFLRWVVIDHAEAKSKLQKALEWVKAHWPAGGVGGTPPQRPVPGR